MEEPKPKRQKVNVACDPCRSRKVKCDGQQPSMIPMDCYVCLSELIFPPVCEPCRKRSKADVACTWDVGAMRIGAQEPTDRIRWLEDKVRMLEQSSRHRRTSLMDGRPSEPKSAVVTAATAATSTAAEMTPHTSGTADASNGSSFHTMIGPTLEENHGEEFFGTASAGNFMQEVKNIVDERLGRASQSTRHDGLPLLVPKRQSGQQPLDYVLPPRKQADSLLDLYWNRVHVFHPYLDKVEIESDYDKIWTGHESISDERSFLCLLNVIFAIASRMVGSKAPEEDEKSALFCSRARTLLDLEVGSVRSVQIFLLLGQYFQSTHEPHSCWLFVSLGVRTAQSIGLHLPETSRRVEDVRIRETLRRVWHGGVILDRMISMMTGRPCIIGPHAARGVPLPQPLEGERTAQDTGSHSEPPSFVDFYIHLLKLYEILHGVLYSYHATIFQSRPSTRRYDAYFGHIESYEGHQSVFELERRLSNWEESLPSHLRINSYSSHEDLDVLYRQAVALHQEHLYVHLLLLRPVLCSFIGSDCRDAKLAVGFGSLLSHRVFLQCAIVCVKAALEGIENIHRTKPERIDVSGLPCPWWYNVLFLYTSATVLIAARLSPSVLNEVSEEVILGSFRTALSLLDSYSIFSTSTPRLTATLRLLSDAVPRQYARLRNQATTDQAAVISPPAERAATLLNVFAQSPSQSWTGQSSRLSGWQNDDPYLAEIWPDLDTLLEPDDFSWLTALPFDTEPSLL